MLTAIFVHNGRTLDYTPTSAVAAGDVVVQGELVGVAKVDIPAGALGALAVEGVFDFPKEPGLPIVAGAKCYWDPGGPFATTESAGATFIGKAVRAAASGDATVRVRMSQ